MTPPKPARKGRGPGRRKAATKPPKSSGSRKAAKSAPPISAPEKTKRRSAGRPPFRPTDEQRKQVTTLAGLGLRHEEIALLVENPTTSAPVALHTLRRHFARELETGALKANAKVAESLFKKATGDGTQAVTAGIWWTKCRMGWKERTVVEVESKSGVLVAPAGQTVEEWIEAAAKRSAAAKEPGTEDDE